jgi:hypothetical protein
MGEHAGVTFKRKSKIVSAVFEAWIPEAPPASKAGPSAPCSHAPADDSFRLQDLGGSDATDTFTSHVVRDKVLHPQANHDAHALEDRLLGIFALNAMPKYLYRPPSKGSGEVIGCVPCGSGWVPPGGPHPKQIISIQKSPGLGPAGSRTQAQWPQEPV